MTSHYLPPLLVLIAVIATVANHRTSASPVRGAEMRRQDNERLNLKEMTAIEIVRQVAKDHPDVVEHIIREVADRVGGVKGDMYYRELMMELETPTDGSGCQACQVWDT